MTLMSTNLRLVHAPETSGPNGTEGARPGGSRVICVGDPVLLPIEQVYGTDRIEVVFCEFHHLPRAMDHARRPSLVLSPLLARRFDCVDVAQMLHQIDFAGMMRAVGDDLPDPDIVRREVRALCPRLDFDLINLDRLRRPHDD